MDSIIKFESISNELLMILFEYYDLYSLFKAFSSLNFRISNILQHCQVHVDLDQVKPIDFVHFLSNILPKINIIAYDKCLIYVNNIRSLNLKNIEIEIIKDMISRFDFNHLERVIFNRIDGDNNWSLFRHFVELNQYRYLRTYKDEISLIGKVESLLSIEQVSLSDLKTLIQ